MSNKIKMLFISSFNPDVLEINGVAKKLWLEIKTFKSFGYDVDYTIINKRGIFLVSNGISQKLLEWKGTYHRSFLELYRLLCTVCYRWNVVYLRYEHLSFSKLKFLRLFKGQTNGLVLAELPTVSRKPYSSDSFKRKLIFYVKRLFDTVAPKKIDYFVTFSNDQEIFGIKTIQIENFTDVHSLPLRNELNISSKRVNLLVLAQLSVAHGVDLVLRGLHLYNSLKNTEVEVFVNIVGEGPILSELKTLASQLELKDSVQFHGSLGGKELDEMFNQSNIGIGAIAIFRKDSSKLSELKIREFTARGLPFVYNAEEPQVDSEFFALKIPFEDVPININAIIHFYHSLLALPSVKERMRNFALSEFVADVQLGKVKNIIDRYFETYNN